MNIIFKADIELESLFNFLMVGVSCFVFWIISSFTEMLGTGFDIISHAGNTLKTDNIWISKTAILEATKENSNSVLPRGMDLLSSSSGSWMLGFIFKSATFPLCDFWPPGLLFLHSHLGN